MAPSDAACAPSAPSAAEGAGPAADADLTPPPRPGPEGPPLRRSGSHSRVHPGTSGKDQPAASTSAPPADSGGSTHGEGKQQGVPVLETGCFSTVALYWLLPMVWRGFRSGKLTVEDLPGLPLAYHSDVVITRAEAEWAQVSQLPRGDVPLVYVLLWRLWKSDLILGSVWSLVQGLSPTVLRPILLRLLIERSASPEHEADGGRLAAVYVVGMLLTLVLEGLGSAATRVYLADRFGVAMTATCAGLLHRKALLVSPECAGQEKSLLGTDVTRCAEALRLLCMLPNCVSSLTGGVIMLFITIGESAAAGVGLMVSVLLYALYLAHRCALVERRSLDAADSRLGLVTRTVEGIKAVKLSAWEEQFMARISAARRLEVKFAKKRRTLYMTSVQLGRCSPVFSAAATVLTAALIGSGFESGRIFAAISIFQALRLSLTMIPAGMTYIATCAVSARRVDNFLLLPDCPGMSTDTEQVNAVEVDGSFRRVAVNAEGKHSTDMERADTGTGLVANPAAGAAGFSLQIGRLSLCRGSVTAVVGPVGSGKTTFLLGLLGELTLSGKCTIGEASVGYVPQQAFVASGTVRYNVLMGRPYDAARYADALRRAALDSDLAALPGGDATEVGERGVTLSGGQQQRLGIARVLYGAPRVLVADDPLAAVDGKVGRHIAENFIFARRRGCENGRDCAADLSPSTVIVSMNQLQLLPQCDHVLVLGGGRIVEQGSFTELAGDPRSSLSAMLSAAGISRSGTADSGPWGEAEEEPAREATGQGSVPLVKDEALASGSLTSGVWGAYLRGMGYPRFAGCVVLSLLAYSCMGASDRYLAIWLEDEHANNGEYAPVYGGMVLGLVAGLILMTIAFSAATAKAGCSLHDDCSQKLFHAPLQWFEATPSGRILSRFSSDLSAVDNTLAYFLENTCGFFATLLVLVIVLCVVVPPVAAVLPVAGVLFAAQIVASDRCNRSLRRLANAAMAPVLTAMTEVSHPQGRPLLRSMGLYGHCWQAYAAAVDELNRRNFLSNAVVAWQTLWSYFISFIVSVVACVWVLWGPVETPDARVGLALTYSFLLPYFLLYSAFCLSVLNISAASLERLLECFYIPAEPEWYTAPGPPASWPGQGALRFDKVVLRYRPELPPALREVTLDIPGGSRVGVVGRTGAGKSSLVGVLFRLVECAGGAITVDGIDIQSIGLQQLRRAMAVIPQEPLVLSGTVRDNLDPFGTVADSRLVDALKHVGGGDLSLDTKVGTGAQGLSSGERQLVSLARTLVRDCRVVVMDEPTSNVDPATDAAVQRALRRGFAGRTVLTIAHRLHTVADADLIVVMDAGRAAEVGQPAQLLADRRSRFAGMVRDLGPAAAEAFEHHMQAMRAA